MLVSLAEIIDRAETLAQGIKTDPAESSLIDSEMTAEAILPSALRYAARQMLAKGENLHNLSKDNLIELETALPDEILRESVRSDSFLPDYPMSSFLDFADYSRVRKDNLLCYYTQKNGRLYSSCAAPQVVKNLTGISMAQTEDTFYLEESALDESDVGKRVRIEIGGILIVDSIIEAVTDPKIAVVRGRALDTALDNGGEGVIYSTANDTLVRSVFILMVEDDNEFTIASGDGLTDADLGRRFSVYDGASLIVDGRLVSYTDANTGQLSAKAVQTSVGGGEAQIMYSGLKLNTPTLPELPATATATFDVQPELVTRWIDTIAAVLTGSLKLEKMS